MSFHIGSTNFGQIYIGSTRIGEVYVGSVKVYPDSAPDPYNPLNLPANTIRCKFSSGYTPTMGDTQTLVDANENVWDIYKSSNDWSSLFYICNSLLEVIGANTSNVTKMENTFYYCEYLTTVSLFDTSNVTNMQRTFFYCHRLTTVPLFDTSNVTVTVGMFEYCYSLTTVPLFNTSSVTSMFIMFHGCTSLTTVPLFDTRNVTSMEQMFDGCNNVQSGALSLYQQASTQATPPSIYNSCFENCGSNTASGQADLSQIPTSWGGTMA